MNAIEQAHQRYERNKAARERQAAKAALPVPVVEAPEIPMERPKSDAVIEVKVLLPTGEFRFTLTKKNVRENVPAHKLTAKEFQRCFTDGLKPLLGDVS